MRPFALFLVTLLAAAASRADERPAYRVRAEAQAQFDLGHYEEALKRYEELYQLGPTPDVLLSVAECHRELGQFKEAARSYRLYLSRADPQSPEAGKARDLLAQMDAAVKQQEAAAQGTAASGGSAKAWSRSAPAAAVPTVVYAPQDTSHKAAYVLGGTAVAALVVGIAFGISSKNAASSLTNGIHSNADENDLAHAHKRNAILADLCFAGSGVLALATVIAW